MTFVFSTFYTYDRLISILFLDDDLEQHGQTRELCGFYLSDDIR